jgi:hypothetical protein
LRVESGVYYAARRHVGKGAAPLLPLPEKALLEIPAGDESTWTGQERCAVQTAEPGLLYRAGIAVVRHRRPAAASA